MLHPPVSSSLSHTSLSVASIENSVNFSCSGNGVKEQADYFRDKLFLRQKYNLDILP